MNKRSHAVAIWMYIGVGMLLIQVILGGVTRLTGSGLSITEWNVLTGTFPPLTNEKWFQEFDKYRQTPQYLLINSDFTLSDFKFIYFWEWLHRLWARLIAVAFLIPFIIFIVKKYFRKDMVRPLIILFLFGALQGAVGWIMVASGLVGDAIYVRPTRLALHFIFAMALIAYAFWFALKLSVPGKEQIDERGIYKWSLFITLITFGQLIYGALMAGHKAATAAPTFPDINGSIIPPALTRYQPLLINLIENKITIHFIHRGVAYLLLLLTFIWTIKALRTKLVTSYFKRTRWLPLSLLFIQVVLGVITLLSSPSLIPNTWGLFNWVAELHQVTGMLFLLAMVWMIYLSKQAKSYI
jgi:cytochrome c oxidase assembly protein subunit 15